MSFANKVCDAKVASTHITLIASLSNMGIMIPRIYTYRIVDIYGIFGPTLIGNLITIIVLLVFYLPITKKLEKEPKQNWWYSQETKKVK